MARGAEETALKRNGAHTLFCDDCWAVVPRWERREVDQLRLCGSTSPKGHSSASCSSHKRTRQPRFPVPPERDLLAGRDALHDWIGIRLVWFHRARDADNRAGLCRRGELSVASDYVEAEAPLRAERPMRAADSTTKLLCVRGAPRHLSD